MRILQTLNFDGVQFWHT